MKKVFLLLLVSLQVFASEKPSDKYTGLLSDAGANSAKELSKSADKLGKVVEGAASTFAPAIVSAGAGMVTASNNAVVVSQNIVTASQTIGRETLQQAGIYGVIAATVIGGGYATYRWATSKTPQAQLETEKAKADLAKLKAESEHKSCLITNKHAPLNAQGIPAVCEDSNINLSVMSSSEHADKINDSFRKSVPSTSAASTSTSSVSSLSQSSGSRWSRMTFGFMYRK